MLCCSQFYCSQNVCRGGRAFIITHMKCRMRSRLKFPEFRLFSAYCVDRQDDLIGLTTSEVDLVDCTLYPFSPSYKFDCDLHNTQKKDQMEITYLPLKAKPLQSLNGLDSSWSFCFILDQIKMLGEWYITKVKWYA